MDITPVLMIGGTFLVQQGREGENRMPTTYVAIDSQTRIHHPDPIFDIMEGRSHMCLDSENRIMCRLSLPAFPLPPSHSERPLRSNQHLCARVLD